MTDVTVTFDITNPDLTPRQFGTVWVQLIDAGGGGVLDDNSVLIGASKVTLDADGHGEIVLTRNTDITPEGTFYFCTVDRTSPTTVRAFRLSEGTADTVAWSDSSIQVLYPVPPSWGTSTGGGHESMYVGAFFLVKPDYGNPTEVPIALIEGSVAYFFTNHVIGDSPWEFAGLYEGHAPDYGTPALPTLAPHQPVIEDIFWSRGFYDLTGDAPLPPPLADDSFTLRAAGISPVNGIDAPVFGLTMEYAHGDVPGPSGADISYDNGTSGLAATDVQAAIDEVAAGGGGGGPSLSDALPIEDFRSANAGESADASRADHVHPVNTAWFDNLAWLMDDGTPPRQDTFTGSELVLGGNGTTGKTFSLYWMWLDYFKTQADALYSALGHDHSGTYQPLDADLTAIAALATDPFGRDLLTKTTAAEVRTYLGLVIGTDVQAYSAKLAALAAQTWAADTITYQTSTSAVSTTSLTSFGRTLAGLANAAAGRTALGLVIGTDVLAPTGSGASLTGIYVPGGTDVAVADGGTGASTASGARTNLGLGTAAVADLGIPTRIKVMPAARWQGTSTALGSPIAPIRSGAATTAIALGDMYLSPAMHSGDTIVSLTILVSATSLTGSQTIDIALYLPATDGLPGARSWTQSITVGTATGALSATSLSLAMPTGPCWIGILNPSGNAGTCTVRTGTSAALASAVVMGNDSFDPIWKLTSVASTPSDMTSYTLRATSSSSSIFGVAAGSTFPVIGAQK